MYTCIACGLEEEQERTEKRRGGGDLSVLKLADVVHAIATTGWQETVTFPVICMLR